MRDSVPLPSAVFWSVIAVTSTPLVVITSSNESFSVLDDSSNVNATRLGTYVLAVTLVAAIALVLAIVADGLELVVVSRATPALHDRNVLDVVFAKYNAFKAFTSDETKFITITSPLLLEVDDAPTNV